jgi:hypothetical protein
MSERSTFVTEYIHCRDCFVVASEVLVSREKHLCSTVVPTWSSTPGDAMPIIAGKIGGLSRGEEVRDLVFGKYGEQLSMRLCHPMRIAVLLDDGKSCVITYAPNEDPKVDWLSVEYRRKNP